MTICPICRGRADDVDCPCGGRGVVESALVDSRRPTAVDLAWFWAAILVGLALWGAAAWAIVEAF